MYNSADVSYTFDGICTILQMSPTHSMAYVQFCRCLLHIFVLSSYRFRDIKFLNCGLQKVCQDHRLQFSKLHHSISFDTIRCHSMANVKIYNCLPHILLRHFLPFQRYNIKIIDLQKVGQGHRVKFLQLHLASIILQKKSSV